jgi:hypothetical protein
MDPCTGRGWATLEGDELHGMIFFHRGTSRASWRDEHPSGHDRDGNKTALRRKSDTLKLDKGATFDKARLKRLRQEDETWEADFVAIPKPMMQNETHYLGLVVTKRDGSVLAEIKVEGRPSGNDLAALLGKAMREPLTEGTRRPHRIHVRGHRQWQELNPHLEELGIKVSVLRELPKITDAYQAHLRQMREARRAKMVRPTAEQQGIEKLFPAIARYVQGYGHIEIGDQEMFGFVARALDYGGTVFEDDRPDTLAEALAALEKGLAKWFEEQGVE